MPPDEIAYHCGAAGKMDPASGKLYTDTARSLFGVKYTNTPYSPNYVTVGIELTHPAWDGRFTEDTLSAATELIVALFRQYPRLGDVDMQLLRHKDITGHKACPKWFCDYPDEFSKFKSRVANALHC
jgi:N-acetylmuramoyl-L-alanine amidase CwlA